MADALDELVSLSNLIGRDVRLVQPGGGNSSVKLSRPDATGRPVQTLLVKGSGTDMRTIDRKGFSRLSLDALAGLRGVSSMSDQEMMQFMAECMLGHDGPTPSVETPLHSLLPHTVIVHTHDVATMSLTNLKDAVAERLVQEVFGGDIYYMPYARPGFPLAHTVDQVAGSIPATAIGMALAHHGLVIWGDTAADCEARLKRSMSKAETYLGSRGRKKASASVKASSPAAVAAVLPAIRGALGATEQVILHLDDSPETLAAIDAVTPAVTSRGVGTPEHILRAGRQPLWLDIDLTASDDQLVDRTRSEISRQRDEYDAYHARHAPSGDAPIADWAKVVLVPRLGMVTAFKDKKNAITANLCYRATLEAIEHAESIDAFQFLPEHDTWEFEHWPLERRKIEGEIERERKSLLLARRVAVIIGGASGIGAAAVEAHLEAGAHVVVADRAAESVTHLSARFPGRVIAVAVDVRDDASLAALYDRTIREFGGLDCLFYTAGLAPRFAPIVALTRDDLQRQLEVHYIGAVRAMAGAATVMRRQGVGGSIVVSVSKAALAPGADAAAYGGSKAALLQALRVAAVELGPDGIRVNAINADQVDTPMFRTFVEERARAKGITVDEQLAAYRKRNLLGVSLIPARAAGELAMLLATDKFRYTTGDIITVDGGLPEAFPR